MAVNGADVIRRYDNLLQAARLHHQKAEAMAPFIAPSRVGILTAFTPGAPQTERVYDSTALFAADIMAMFIASTVINPAQRWMGLKMHDPRVQAQDDVREWLEEGRDRMFARYSASSFYAEAPEMVVDYGGFGTGALRFEEIPTAFQRRPGFRGLTFEAIKTGRFVIAENAIQEVDTLYRQFTITARAAQQRWGADALPENMQRALRGDSSVTTQDRLFPVIHGVYPRPPAERGGYGNRGMPWVSCWVERESKHVIEESGYRHFPYCVPRYHRTPGEVLGRGRGDIAFPDTQTLNEAKHMGFEDWALKIRPPVLQAHDSVMGALRLVPGGGTTVNTKGRPLRDVLAPYETGSHPEVSQIKEEELRKSIRQIFFVDQILQLLEVHKTEMTAFEFAKKLGLLFQLMAPVYGRMEGEFLRPLVDRTFDLMLAQGEFPPPPPSVLQSDGQIDVEFLNPLARAQRLEDVQAITNAMTEISPFADRFPEMWDSFDMTAVTEKINDVYGVPASVRNSMDQILQIRAQRQQQKQQEAMMQTGLGVSEGLKNVAPFVKALKPPAALPAQGGLPAQAGVAA